MTPDWVIKLEAEPCECVSCPDCNSGQVYYDIGGRYIGKNRMDDMCEMETCDTCGGSAITDECERCIQLNDYDREEQP
jgi:hypothetical protein